MFFRVIQSNNATKLWQKQQETLIFQLEQEQNRYHNFQEHRRTKAIIFILSGLPVLSLLFFSTLSSTLSPFSSISFFSFLSITLSIFSFLKVSSTLTSWTIFFFTWSTKTSLLFSFCSLSSTKSPFFLDHQKLLALSLFCSFLWVTWFIVTEGLFSTISGTHQILRHEISSGENSRCADASVTANSGDPVWTPEDGSRTK